MVPPRETRPPPRAARTLCLVLEPSQATAAAGARADVVIGVPAEPDGLAATDAALAVQAALADAFPDRTARVLVLTDDPNDARAPDAPLTSSRGTPPRVFTGGHLGPDAALPTLLEAAIAQEAPACALLEPLPRPPGSGWLRLLLEPILEGGHDLVCPSYQRGKLEGLIATGLVYPLTRALFARRLRQPLGREIAVSRGLAERLLRDEEWRTDPAHAGADLWVVTKALAGGVKLAQAFLGPRPPPAAPAPEPSVVLPRVCAELFHEIDRHARTWQRLRGSDPVATFGDPHLPEEPAAPASTASLVQAFTLGKRDLRPIWSAVLPPQSVLHLSRLDGEGAPEAFRMPDGLWARVVYDFAVGWRVKALERSLLLRAMTPVYLGWVASWVNEVGHLGAEATEARLEALCRAFEAEKPYLISRWRWPDRFGP
jgi:hypothetical protein